MDRENTQARFAPLMARIAEIRREKPAHLPVLVAIDGPCAGGKTTLAAQLGEALGAQVLHMDDFFLQPHQRTPERYAAPGENVDHERFYDEVLLPLSRGETPVYRPFDCGRLAIGEAVPVRVTPVVIIEGSYSLHPQLEGLYDLRVLLRVHPDTQRRRILQRNGEEGLRMFLSRWIPLENSYFASTAIASRCHMEIPPEGGGLGRHEALAERFAMACRAVMGDDLVGVYLHGSGAMGCFHEEKSDVDLLAVVRGAMTAEQRRALMDHIMALDALAPQKGIEMSVMQAGALRPFVHPAPYELHFSRAHIDWYRRDPVDYVDKMRGVDPDLAAHCTVTLHRGRTIWGKPIAEVFDSVPWADYMDSILSDVEHAGEDVADNPVYVILNLCRVLAAAQERLVLSKQEGGEWGLTHLPEHAALIGAALGEYATGEPAAYDMEAARAFAGEMLGRIRKTN